MKYIKLFMIGLAVVGFIAACSHQSRNPSVGQRQIQGMADVSSFNEDPIAWLDEVKATSLEDFCSSKIMDYTELMGSMEFENLDRVVIAKIGKEWLKKSFQLKVYFNRNMPGLSDVCRDKLVSFFRELRQLEDYVGEIAYNLDGVDPKKDVDFKKIAAPILENQAYPNSPYQLAEDYNKDGNGFEFKAGDIVITMGVSPISSTITQSTTNRAHYSHGVFVHKSPDGKMQTIESYLKQGVAFYTIEEAMKNENARILVFRSRDQELAEKASDIMGKTLREKGSIPYDYAMDVKNHDKMFCAEVIVSAYEWASEGKLKIPYKMTDIRYKNPYVLKKMNISAEPTFSPISMEVDPRFDLVLEWRDYNFVRSQRQKDMTLRKIFDWMESKEYIMHETFTTLGLRTIWATRHFPFIWNWASKPFDLRDVPKDTPKSFLVSAAQISNLTDLVLEEVKKADDEYKRDHGYPMSERKLLEFLEKFREEDAEKYKYRGAAKFHHIFRPWSLVQESHD